MKLAKYLLIGFLVVQTGWLVSMEPDDGGVTESKSISSSSTSTKADGLASDELLDTNYDYANYLKIIEEGEYAGMLTIAYNGDIITVPKEIWSEFKVLENRFQSDFGFKKEFEIGDLNYLYELFKAIQPTTDLKSYSISDLINLIYYANSLLIKNWKLLDPVLRYIKQTVKPDQLVGLDLLEIDVFSTINSDVLDELKNVSKVRGAPRGDSYWVIFRDKKAQHFDIAGDQEIGKSLRNVNDIYWSPDGQYYVVIYDDIKYGDARLYSIAGEAIGPRVGGVIDIEWEPNGRSYFVIFGNQTARRYSVDGTAVRALLENVSGIRWEPNGRSYFVISRDQVARHYNVDGRVVGEPLRDVIDIKWEPNGRSYFVIFGNQTARHYNVDGRVVGEPLQYVIDIKWEPNGRSYFVMFGSNFEISEINTVQRYSSDGVVIGRLLEFAFNIKWALDGQKYWVFFGKHKTLIVCYNNDGKLLKKLSGRRVRRISNGPKGFYFIIFEDGTVEGHSSIDESGLKFGQKLIVWAILNEYARSKEKIHLNPLLRSQLPSETKDQLIRYGYLAPKKLFAGALSPTVAAILKRQAKS